MRYLLYVAGMVVIGWGAILVISASDSAGICQGLGASCQEAFSAARGLLGVDWAAVGMGFVGLGALIGAVEDGLAKIERRLPSLKTGEAAE